jgi:predicted metal-dependent hydrolase
MIDWLKRDPRKPPTLTVTGRELPLVIRRIANARRLTLRLAPDGSQVRVTMPRWCRTADALAFAASRIGWLEAQAASLPLARPVGPDASLFFRGSPVRVVHDPRAPRRPELNDGALLAGGPVETLERRLKRWLSDQARLLLSADLAGYCDCAGLAAPALALSNARRRWGSCSPTGAIRINWRLVMAPDFVRRSVVAHEVAHLVHFDHSPRFHAFLDELYEGDVAQANRWLKHEGRQLYGVFG